MKILTVLLVFAIAAILGGVARIGYEWHKVSQNMRRLEELNENAKRLMRQIGDDGKTNALSHWITNEFITTPVVFKSTLLTNLSRIEYDPYMTHRFYDDRTNLVLTVIHTNGTWEAVKP